MEYMETCLGLFHARTVLYTTLHFVAPPPPPPQVVASDQRVRGVYLATRLMVVAGATLVAAVFGKSEAPEAVDHQHPPRQR